MCIPFNCENGNESSKLWVKIFIFPKKQYKKNMLNMSKWRKGKNKYNENNKFFRHNCCKLELVNFYYNIETTLTYGMFINSNCSYLMHCIFFIFIFFLLAFSLTHIFRQTAYRGCYYCKLNMHTSYICNSSLIIYAI